MEKGREVMTMRKKQSRSSKRKTSKIVLKDLKPKNARKVRGGAVKGTHYDQVYLSITTK